MERTRSRTCLFFSFFLFSVFVLFNSRCVESYKNYTVGDSLGWFDDLQVPKADYQKWAAGKNFSLGDFLIFNTDKNHSVVQTYNETIFKNCDYNDADATDTTEWSAGEPAFDNSAVTVAVPLVKQGLTYFFSGNYDGEQCEHGQHLKITVMHGQGLPPSLSPPSDAPAPNAADNGDAVPDTVVPSNFDNPHEDADGNVKATSEGFKTGIKFASGLLVACSLIMVLKIFE